MYKVEFTESAVKQLKKLDKQTVRVIKNWVIKNLVNTPDPRLHGKALKGNLKGIWRYRVGDYRLFASIEEEIITISIFEIGHRRDIYKKIGCNKFHYNLFFYIPPLIYSWFG